MDRIGLAYFLFAFCSSMAAGIREAMPVEAWAQLVCLSVVAGLTALFGYLRQPPPGPPPGVVAMAALKR